MPRPMIARFLALSLALASLSAAAGTPCAGGTVFEDRDGDGQRDPGEPGIAGVKVSDGEGLAVTDAHGAFRLPTVDGRTVFVIKPAGYAVPTGANGLPLFWHRERTTPGASATSAHVASQTPACDFALRAAPATAGPLDVLVFADPQPKSLVDVGYYERDIVEPLLAGHARGARVADLGLSLGDIVNDDLSLYPAVNRVTARLGTPWLHAPGNHDLDSGAASDEASLRGFHAVYGPDSYAWEEPQANIVVLDDVVLQPQASPRYVGGLREEQFDFLQRYLPTLSKDRLLVLAMHIPLFDAAPGVETFRHADRERLFELLKEFPKVLVLSGHAHTQQHVFHGAASGWQGATPLHEYNVGAASGAFWSGVKDAAGIPAATMSDGTPNGYARMRIQPDGRYALAWQPARVEAASTAMALHAPRVLRRGAYPAWGVYANVYMGRPDSRVEFRVDGGAWTPMKRVEQPDPALLAENVRDDEAAALRGYDRSPEATPSAHLWRGALPTDLAAGEHEVEVRAFDPWQGEQRATTRYRLQDASP